MEVALIFIAISIAFIICRELLCWYWKINEHLENQKTMISLLKRINEKLDNNDIPSKVDGGKDGLKQ